jgi:hypothetical protein
VCFADLIGNFARTVWLEYTKPVAASLAEGPAPINRVNGPHQYFSFICKIAADSVANWDSAWRRTIFDRFTD